MDLRKLLKKGPIIGLSPMDGVTDEPFRLTQSHIAKPDLIFTEFVSAEGIAHGAVKLFDQLMFSSEERPIVAQLFGKNPDSFYTAAIILCHLGFDGIDINMGCPAKTVTQHGSGAALIDKPDIASQIIKSTQKAIADFTSGHVKLADLHLHQKTLDVITRNLNYSKSTIDNRQSKHEITLSIKTRLGTTTSVVDTWIPFLVSHHPDFITLHGRTLKQGYSGQADWSEISKAVTICHQNGVPIFGNGDIANKKQALEYISEYQVDGILIGRAADGNPWVFSDNPQVDFQHKFSAMKYHAHKFVKIFPNRRFDPLRRVFLSYTRSHPRAKDLRSQIVTLTSIDQLLSLEPQFLDC